MEIFHTEFFLKACFKKKKTLDSFSPSSYVENLAYKFSQGEFGE